LPYRDGRETCMGMHSQMCRSFCILHSDFCILHDIRQKTGDEVIRTLRGVGYMVKDEG